MRYLQEMRSTWDMQPVHPCSPHEVGQAQGAVRVKDGEGSRGVGCCCDAWHAGLGAQTLPGSDKVLVAGGACGTASILYGLWSL